MSAPKNYDPAMNILQMADLHEDKMLKKAEKFALTKEAHREICQLKADLHNNGKAPNGMVASSLVWKDVPQKMRMNIYASMMGYLIAGKPLEDAPFAVPSWKAAITVDPTQLVQLVDSTVMEIAEPMRYGELLLMRGTHPRNAQSVTGQIPASLAESYILKPKTAAGSYEKVASGVAYGSYTIEELGLEVDIDKFSQLIFAWDEVARQIRLLAQGAARTENLWHFNAFTTAYATPVAALQNVGGTGLSAIYAINAQTTPRFGVAATAGDFIYEDMLNAARVIQDRPNAVQLRTICVQPVQWLQAQLWAVQQKVQFAQVLGREMDLQPSPAYDGQVVPYRVVVDSDLPTIAIAGTNYNIILFVGPPEYVGVFKSLEDFTINQVENYSRNVTEIPVRMSAGAVVTGYRAFAIEIGLSTT